MEKTKGRDYKINQYDGDGKYYVNMHDSALGWVGCTHYGGAWVCFDTHKEANEWIKNR